MICLCFKQIARKERAIRSKNSYVFDSFSSFLCPRANPSCRFLLICSLFKSDLSNSFPLLFTKEQPWAIRSGCSWQKSDRERFSQVAHDKRAREAIRSFPWANHSFAVLLKKNKLIARKNLWANSPPWKIGTFFQIGTSCSEADDIWPDFECGNNFRPFYLKGSLLWPRQRTLNVRGESSDTTGTWFSSF